MGYCQSQIYRRLFAKSGVRPKSRARRPAAPARVKVEEVEAILRELAFVLHVTRQISEELREEKTEA